MGEMIDHPDPDVLRPNGQIPQMAAMLHRRIQRPTWEHTAVGTCPWWTEMRLRAHFVARARLSGTGVFATLADIGFWGFP